MSSSIHTFKALADETRLRILYVLNRFELNVNELVSMLGMGQSRVSRHLKILAEAGLLEARRDGLWMFYSTPKAGPRREFINAILPFVVLDSALEADLAMAAGVLDERAAKTRQFFNTVAEEWDRMSGAVLGGFDLAEAVLRVMPKCAAAVDLGCGTGNLSARLLEKAGLVIGVDGSARMLELARRRFAAQPERVSLRIGDLEHLPLRDGEADFACLNMVLHHLSDPVAALREIRRVIKPGGKLFLSDFDRHDHEAMRAEYGDCWLGFSAETLSGFLREAGFAMSSSRTEPVEKGLRLHLLLAESRE